jgi:hypothetical protein
MPALLAITVALFSAATPAEGADPRVDRSLGPTTAAAAEMAVFSRPVIQVGAAPAVRKVTPASEAEIARNRNVAMAWFEKARKDICPEMHLVETRDFLIFSTWPHKDDAKLADSCEKMHAHLRQQFMMPRDQQVWAGKLPIYLLEDKQQYHRFTDEVDQRKSPEAGGYLSQQSDGFCHMVLNHVHSATYFYGLLVHEGTHAFLARYATTAALPTWLNEGLAEAMAAQLVPGCTAAARYLSATRAAVLRDIDPSPLFKTVELNELDYGLAQSLVRFLLARDRKAFIQLIKLLKVGTEESEALSRAYGLTREELVRQWKAASQRAVKQGA